jgi:transcriptional regulator GlxA family with amidase domain
MGAYLPSYTPTSTELALVRKSYDDCTAFIAICGGMMAAQLAGILVDKTAAAPRFIIPMLQKQDPRTTWVDRRWVREGTMWTSGALLNGLDLMEAFMKTYWPELAELAARVGALPFRSVEYVGYDGYS